MPYQVLKSFRDSEDELYLYIAGKEYPREGYDPSQERIEELSGKDNTVGERLIAEVSEVEAKQEEESDESPAEEKSTEETESKEDNSDYPKHTGGGWYELSNGDKVQGKDEAAQAEKEL